MGRFVLIEGRENRKVSFVLSSFSVENFPWLLLLLMYSICFLVVENNNNNHFNSFPLCCVFFQILTASIFGCFGAGVCICV